MKKNLFKLTVMSCGITACCYFHFSKENNHLNDVVLQNIEALAEQEDTSPFFCYRKGDVDCHGDKVEIKITGRRF